MTTNHSPATTIYVDNVDIRNAVYGVIDPAIEIVAQCTYPAEYTLVTSENGKLRVKDNIDESLWTVCHRGTDDIVHAAEVLQDQHAAEDLAIAIEHTYHHQEDLRDWCTGGPRVKDEPIPYAACRSCDTMHQVDSSRPCAWCGEPEPIRKGVIL